MKSHALVLAAVLVLGATAAQAHARLQSASPAVNSMAKSPPTEIRLQFDDELDDWKSSISLFDGQGHEIALGKTRLTGKPPLGLSAVVRERLKPGAYEVKWRASSSDGHESHGDFAFRVQAR